MSIRSPTYPPIAARPVSASTGWASSRWTGATCSSSSSTSAADRWDCSTLGSYRYVAKRGEEEYAFRGTFPFVGEDKIVQTFTFEGMPDAVSLETLWFEDLGDGRTRLHGQSLVDSFEGRDAWLASGMETGVDQGYAKLDVLLGEL